MTASGIGIALGSGGARGIAHIGVLKALQQQNIEPDIVAGCSMGALVGAFYCLDKLDDLQNWLQSLTTADFIYYLNPRLSAPGGVADASRMIDYFRQCFGDPEIESLPRRYAAVATNLNTGQEVWLQQGKLWDAVRASIALPGVITPIAQGKQWLSDGGLVNPVPVSLCRAMGAELILAVNLNGDLVGRHLNGKQQTGRETAASNDGQAPVSSEDNRLFERLSRNWRHESSSTLFRQWSQSDNDNPSLANVLAAAINVMQDRVTRSRLAGEPPDLMLSPRLAEMELLDFQHSTLAIEEGRRCVEAQQENLDFLINKL